MKYIAIIFTILIVIAAGCAVLSGGGVQGDIYEGTAQGYRGTITVQVRIHNGNITEITVMDSQEDRSVGEAAMEELIDIIIDNNNTDVDAISGATITSKGFINAVNNALTNYRR